MRGGIKGEAEGEWNEDANFEYCWKKASGGGGGVPSAAVKIPGHQSAKPVSKSPKSPRSPKSPKSPGTLSSHKKSPMSDLVALSDASLKEMKDALLNSDKRCQLQIEIENRYYNSSHWTDYHLNKYLMQQGQKGLKIRHATGLLCNQDVPGVRYGTEQGKRYVIDMSTKNFSHE